MTKKKKIEMKEKKIIELENLFERVPDNKKKLVKGLIEQAAFMYVQLTELIEIIEKNGVVEDFKQGKQQFTREQPAVKTYNAMLKNYNLTIKQLLELIPPGELPKFADEFEEFKQRRNR